MNIEENIFKHADVNIDKLLKYGFKKIDDYYFYSTNIMNDSFRVEITYDNKFKGKVIELNFNEEYNNFRIENITGEFVCKVRNEFEKVLLDIKDNCCNIKYFLTKQANRIISLIKDKYGDNPDFPWDDAMTAGVLRNNITKKWYALIMDINKNKICKKNELTNIINVKLDENEIFELLKLDGFYKAYHMNKKKWITILLDDTLSDEEIMKYIDESYNFAKKK